jgi:hypothetical protein
MKYDGYDGYLSGNDGEHLDLDIWKANEET